MHVISPIIPFISFGHDATSHSVNVGHLRRFGIVSFTPSVLLHTVTPSIFQYSCGNERVDDGSHTRQRPSVDGDGHEREVIGSSADVFNIIDHRSHPTNSPAHSESCTSHRAAHRKLRVHLRIDAARVHNDEYRRTDGYRAEGAHAETGASEECEKYKTTTQ